MPDRSYLFVPGDRPERFDKALLSGAHAVILDLEDAVHPSRKDVARDAIAQWLPTAAAPVYVRINPTGTPWHKADTQLLQLPQLRGVMLPKAENAEELHALSVLLAPPCTLLPLVESVAGYFALAALARAPRVERLAFGSFDFMADANIQGDGAELDHIRTQLVLHSKHAGLPAPIDGVSLAIQDLEQLSQDVQHSKQWGMGAKLCIHPGQVNTVHAGFAPTADEIAWAQQVLAALEQGTSGAVTVQGKLVDQAIALRAKSVISEAASILATPA